MSPNRTVSLMGGKPVSRHVAIAWLKCHATAEELDQLRRLKKPIGGSSGE